MKNKKLISTFILVLLLAACQRDEPVVTPPVVPEVSPTTAVVETIPATNTNTPTAETEVTEPESPTAVPTDTATDTPIPPTETPVAAAPVSSIQLIPIATEGTPRSIYLTHAGDERLFVVQQNGIIRIIQAGEVIEEPFLNIRDRVALKGTSKGC